MNKRVLVIGSANVDFTMWVPVFPRTGESVNGGPFLQSFGGKGSNQAIAARRAGAAVDGVFNLGGDGYADRLWALYLEEGLSIDFSRKNPGLLCGTGFMLVDRNGDNRICTSLEANASLSPEMVTEAEALFAHAGMLLLQMEIPDDALDRAISLAEKHRVEVMLNCAPARETAVRIDRRIGILVVNEMEAESLTGSPVADIPAALAAAASLSRRGPATVIVTLGRLGCVTVASGDEIVTPAFEVDAVDPTAAGDTFAGAFAAAVCGGMDLREALRFACAAGALCVRTAGALPSLPSASQISSFLAERSGLAEKLT